ncbi:MAG: CD1871A family CXXC motif-containing protein [Lachnospiraceae bacterium]|nr:CD1871A family CXXC motif-containing protein [Lachnospiraceae bacterium]
MSFWRRSRQHLWIAGVMAGILFLCLGAVNGQFPIIWKKAVMICMECIGIG